MVLEHVVKHILETTPCHFTDSAPQGENAPWCTICGRNRKYLFVALPGYTIHNHTFAEFVAAYPSHYYNDVIMSAMVSQITSLSIVYSTVYSGADQRKHQSSASLAFVRGNSPETSEFPAQIKWPVTRKMFPFDDVIMINHTRDKFCQNF